MNSVMKNQPRRRGRKSKYRCFAMAQEVVLHRRSRREALLRTHPDMFPPPGPGDPPLDGAKIARLAHAVSKTQDYRDAVEMLKADLANTSEISFHQWINWHLEVRNAAMANQDFSAATAAANAIGKAMGYDTAAGVHSELRSEEQLIEELLVIIRTYPALGHKIQQHLPGGLNLRLSAALPDQLEAGVG